MKKRWISLIVAGIMMMNLLSLMGELLVNAEEVIISEEVVASGTCGENLTWTLNREGTLIISGTGKMYNWDDSAPWWEKRESIKKVTIIDGVTSIGDLAFIGSGLTNITIPDSVTSIGESAFDSCESLTSITIPDSVTSIGESAFFACSNLASIRMPESARSIGKYAFYSCESLRSITIPKGITKINDSTFSWCSSLTSVTIPDTVKVIGEEAFNYSESLSTITIPTSVTNIRRSAFQGSGLRSIMIPGSVTSLGNSVFSFCKNLKNVTISEGLTSIGHGTFNYCNGLTTVEIPASVTSIGDSFFDCYRLENINISQNNSTYTSVDGVVYSKDMKTLVRVPGGKKDSYEIVEGVTNIYGNAFSSCTSLTNILIPDSVSDIGENAFNGCNSLTNIIIPRGVTSIKDFTFFNCSSLKSITIPDGVTNIGQEVFYSCRNLSDIIFKGNAPLINDNAFAEVMTMARYPANDLTWTEEVKQNYGGTITWVPYENESDKDEEVLKYDIEDTYSFDHKGRSISYSIWSKFFDSFTAISMILDGNGTHGVCYGMALSAITSSACESPKVESYNCSNLSEVKESTYSEQSNMTVSQYIEYAYASQYTEKTKELKANANTNLNDLYDAVISNIQADGEPIMLAIRGRKRNVGHALWVVGIGKNTNKETELMVYDCNHPKELRPLILKKEDGKYVSWRYKIFDTPEYWGTGEINAQLKFFNPADFFINLYGEKTGYTPVKEKNKMLIMIDNMSSSLVLNEESIILSPETEDERIEYIETYGVNDDIKESQKQKDYYWVDIENDFVIETTEKSEMFMASDEDGAAIKLEVPSQTEVNVSLSGDLNNSIEMEVDSNEKYSITYSGYNEEKNIINSICLSGKSDGNRIVSEQKDNSIILNTEDMNGVEVTIVQNDDTGETKNSVTIPVLTKEDSIMVRENNDKVIILEDTDNDNLYETTIACSEHTWDKGFVTKKATCKAEGEKKYTCTKCNETKTEIIKILGHNYNAKWTIDKEATTSADGSKSKHCTRCSAKASVTPIYKASGAKLSTASYTYNGKTKSPKVYVKDSKGKTISSSNYTISTPSGRKNVGQYTYKITFKNEYSGTTNLTLKINPKGTSISKLSKAKKAFTVKWKKQSGKMKTSRISGYQIQYSTSKKFTNAKTKTVSGYSKTSQKISKLKAKKTYYVRVRTYKTVKVSGKSVKLYSGWSKMKSVKTK